MATPTPSTSLLATHFNRPVSTEYFHHIMKTRFSASFYRHPDLLKRVGQVREKVQTRPLDMTAANGWTPLHVAVLANNPLGALFLLSCYAKTDIKDRDGYTPADYDKRYQFNILPIIDSVLKHPAERRPSLALRALREKKCKRFLDAMLSASTPLPSRITCDPETDDFGKQLTHLICLPCSVSTELAKIGEIEGFMVSPTSKPYYPRDSFIKDSAGSIFAPNSNCDSVDKAISQAVSAAAYFGNSGTVSTSLVCLTGHMGISKDYIRNAISEAKANLSSTRSLPFYIEGGNLFTLTNAQGVKKILIGHDHLLQIHAELRLKHGFPNDLAADSDFSLEQINTAAEEMYAMGLPPFSNETHNGFLKISEIVRLLHYRNKENSNRKSVREMAIAAGLISPFPNITENTPEIQEVRLFLAQRRWMLTMLASHFQISPNDLHFIPQGAYHLDIFLQPGPNGSVFIQDYNLCVEVLENLHHLVDLFDLSDKLMRLQYLEVAKRLSKDLGPILEKAKETLINAGFTVIPIPGAFYDSHENERDVTNNIHFLNALTGWSEKLQRHYYITTGAHVGSCLGEILMQYFSGFLKKYQPDLEIYFLGENPQKPGDFSAAMELWNQRTVNEKRVMGLLAGVHCLSFDLKSSSRVTDEIT